MLTALKTDFAYNQLENFDFRSDVLTNTKASKSPNVG